MRYKTLAGLALAMTASPWVQAHELTVEVEGIESTGVIMLRIFSNEAQFKGEETAIMSLRQQLSAGNFSFSTSGLPEGDYGVRLMYDTNGNGELDTNMIGMPTEPWAFSNNATGSFGPPDWSAVKFRVEADTRQSIRLNQ